MIKPARGSVPSVQALPPSAQKLYSTVSVPLGAIRKATPPPFVPPASVVPYRFPAPSMISALNGNPPSVQALPPSAQKLYSTVSTQPVIVGASLNTVPALWLPPN